MLLDVYFFKATQLNIPSVGFYSPRCKFASDVSPLAVLASSFQWIRIMGAGYILYNCQVGSTGIIVFEILVRRRSKVAQIFILTHRLWVNKGWPETNIWCVFSHTVIQWVSVLIRGRVNQLRFLAYHGKFTIFQGVCVCVSIDTHIFFWHIWFCLYIIMFVLLLPQTKILIERY